MESKQFILMEFMNSSSNIQLSKRLLRYLDGNCEAAIMLTDLIGEYWKNYKKNELATDGSFAIDTPDHIKARYGFSTEQQRKGLEVLQMRNLVSFSASTDMTERSRIDFEAIFNMLFPFRPNDAIKPSTKERRIPIENSFPAPTPAPLRNNPRDTPYRETDSSYTRKFYQTLNNRLLNPYSKFKEWLSTTRMNENIANVLYAFSVMVDSIIGLVPDWSREEFNKVKTVLWETGILHQFNYEWISEFVRSWKEPTRPWVFNDIVSEFCEFLRGNRRIPQVEYDLYIFLEKKGFIFDERKVKNG